MITASLVLFHNSREQIETVLKCVQNSTVPVTLFLIDNSLNQEHFSWLQERVAGVSQVRYQYLGDNVGFGRGHNKVLGELGPLGSQYHVILNPDVSFAADVFVKLQQFMDEHLDVGLVAPKVIYPDGSLQHLCRLVPTPYDLFIRRTGLKSLIEKNNERYELRKFSYDRTVEVPILSGCFMFFRSAVFLKLQGFDERYFMYLEDFDLSRRALAFGKNVFFPEVTVVHDYGKGSYRSKKLLWAHISSAVKYFNKWGWFFDSVRSKINQRALSILNLS